MNILFYRYGNICEPDMVAAFSQAGLNVVEECSEITNKTLTYSDQLKLVENHINNEKPLFVFSINFFPVISDLCQIYSIPYLCWTVDSPVLELFHESISNSMNRIFLFDSAQFEAISKYNPEHTFYLPLAAASGRFDNIMSTTNHTDISRFSSDISFVGNLYSEKDLLRTVLNDAERNVEKNVVINDDYKNKSYINGYIDALTESSIGLYGYYSAKNSISPEFAKMIPDIIDSNYMISKPIISEAELTKYIFTHQYLSFHIASVERIRTLNKLAEHFSVDLYTRSDIAPLTNVNTHSGISSLNEMPKVFNLSKINLNMTLRSIENGLPLRIFDILGCGGFLMTNYQSDLDGLFVISEDLEAYSSIDELIDKCAYYLSHEEERNRIAKNGYEKAKALHTHFHRIKFMLEKLS